MIDLRVLFASVLGWLLIASPAFAACTEPPGDEGVIVYNPTHKIIQFCDGHSWISTVGGVGSGSGSGAGLEGTGWSLVDSGDTAPFDAECRYRFSNAGFAHYSKSVRPEYLLFDVPIGEHKYGAIEMASKGQVWHRAEANLDTTSGSPVAIEALESFCPPPGEVADGGGGDDGDGEETVILLTAGTSWTVPADWNPANNKIEVIGGGGNGSGLGTSKHGGGGGGAYSAVEDLNLTPGATIPYVVGAAAGDSYFNGANCGGSSVCAKGGQHGAVNTGGLGGAAADGVGDVKFSGGAGGEDSGRGGGGGGGAAGPDGDGGAGGSGGTTSMRGGNGGGGANGGGPGAVSSGNNGGDGGHGPSGSGGGLGGTSLTNCEPEDGNSGCEGTLGGAGGGGRGKNASGGAGTGDGGVGSQHVVWTDTAGSIEAGPGAGGGGGGGNGDGSTRGDGGAAASYGGGGGGGGDGADSTSGAGGAGAPGIIVITYVPGGAVPEDTTPDAFAFTDQTDVPVSTVITSNSINIAGIDVETSVSVTGTGAEISINGGGWVTSGNITNGQSLQVRLTSSASNSTAMTATVDVGGVTEVWSVTTEDSGATISLRSSAKIYNSNTIVAPNDIQAGDLLIFADKTWASGIPPTNMPPGFTAISNVTDSVEWRQLVSYKIADGSEAGAALAGLVKEFSGSYKILLVFSGNFTGASVNSVNGEMTGGDPAQQTVAASGGAAPLLVLGVYSANGSAQPARSFSPAEDGEVGITQLNTGLWARYKAYNGPGTNTTVDQNSPSSSVSNGLQSAYISVTQGGAADTTPESFSFVDVTGANPSTLTTATPVTISGINASTPVSVTGTGAQISINGGSWVTSGNITNGQTLSVRLTSSALASTAVTTIVTVGGVSDTWSVTTEAAGDCTVAGDTCADGSIYVGEGLYLMDVDLSTSLAWATVYQTNSGSQSTTNGAANQNWIVANRSLAQYLAFGACSGLEKHGRDDWYLPAEEELRVVHGARGEIANLNAVYYWSSSESTGNNMLARSIKFSGSGSDTGAGGNSQKDTTGRGVRCVRYEAPSGGGPTGCPTIGNTCSDGSKFAGDTNMYVTDVNQSTLIKWSTVNTNTGADSTTDGASNQAWIVDNATLSQFPAFQTCLNLERHGHDDWYLPSKAELNVLYTNRTAIGGFTTNGNWSSTEYNNSNAWGQGFGNGVQYYNGKSFDFDVRCVRRS